MKVPEYSVSSVKDACEVAVFEVAIAFIMSIIAGIGFILIAS